MKDTTRRDEILAVFPFSDYYEREVGPLKGDGDWRTGRCCFHGDEHPSFRVNVTRGRGGAWECKAGCGKGDLFSFIARRLGVSTKGGEFKKVLDEAERLAGEVSPTSRAHGQVKPPPPRTGSDNGYAAQATSTSSLGTAKEPAKTSSEPEIDVAALWARLPLRDEDGERYLAKRGLAQAVERGIFRFRNDKEPLLDWCRYTAFEFRVAMAVKESDGKIIGINFRGNYSKEDGQRFHVIGKIRGGFYGEPERVAGVKTLIIAEGMFDTASLMLASSNEKRAVVGLHSATELTNLPKLIASFSGEKIVMVPHLDAAGSAALAEVRRLALARGKEFISLSPLDPQRPDADANDNLRAMEGDPSKFRVLISAAWERMAGGIPPAPPQPVPVPTPTPVANSSGERTDVESNAVGKTTPAAEPNQIRQPTTTALVRRETFQDVLRMIWESGERRREAQEEGRKPRTRKATLAVAALGLRVETALLWMRRRVKVWASPELLAEMLAVPMSRLVPSLRWLAARGVTREVVPRGEWRLVLPNKASLQTVLAEFIPIPASALFNLDAFKLAALTGLHSEVEEFAEKSSHWREERTSILAIECSIRTSFVGVLTDIGFGLHRARSSVAALERLQYVDLSWRGHWKLTPKEALANAWRFENPFKLLGGGDLAALRGDYSEDDLNDCGDEDGGAAT